MKQKDIALIGAAVIFSGIISFLLSGRIFTNSGSKLEAEKVDALSSDFSTPDSRYFNNNSIDPTPAIQIGNNNNQNPFNSTQ